MDESDHATQQEEFARDAALAVRKPQAKIYLMGTCWNCENVCAGLFCDTYCRDDHMKREGANKRAGI